MTTTSLNCFYLFYIILHQQQATLCTECDGYPIFETSTPTNSVDGRLRGVVRHLRCRRHERVDVDVPDHGALVLADAAQSVAVLRRPGDGVDGLGVVRVQAHGSDGVAHVDDHYSRRLGDGRGDVRAVARPGDAQHRVRRALLVDDCAIVHGAEIEDANGAVSAARREDALAGSEGAVVHGAVVGDELHHQLLLEDVPHADGRVRGRRGDHRRLVDVPVKGGDRL